MDGLAILSARLSEIEVVGKLDKKGDYSVVIYIDGEEVAKSGRRYGVAPLQWQEDHTFKFRASSTMKIILLRHSSVPLRGSHQIGEYASNVGPLIENDKTLYLMDDMDRTILAGLKIKLSVTSESTLDFMRRVDDDITRLQGNNLVTSALGHIDTTETVVQMDHGAAKVLGSCLVPLGKALQLIVKVMDNLAEAHPILKVSWTVLSAVYKTLDAQIIQDEAVRDLAESLREMLGVAAAFPNLLVVKGTTDVLEEIGQASLRVASLIDEYTRHSFPVRTARFQITDDMKTRIDLCKKKCNDLMEKLDRRVRIGTSEIVTKIDYVQKGFRTIKDAALASKVAEWLAAPDSSRNYNDARKKHREGTGSWFIDGEKFLEWKKSRESFLCIYGKAGCGKTVLCSTIISHVADICQKQQSSAFAYFFFDGRDAQSALQRHDGFIRSLIQQFVDQCDGIPASLAELRGSGHQQPSTEILEETLQHILGGFSHAYIMVDSLDECAERRELLAWITKLICGKVRAPHHLFVTSRPEQEIEADLKCPNKNRIDLNEEHVDRDIETYIDAKIQTEPRLNRWDEEVRMRIKEKLMEKAEGTFRWVAMQLEELQKCLNKAGLYAQLDRLPKDLDETYHRILTNIDEQHRPDAVKFLQWIAFSARPLTLQEIAETAAFDYDPENGPKYNPDLAYQVPGDVFIACSSLIVKSEVTWFFKDKMERRWPNRHWTDNMRTTVKLSHFSVKEYLLSERIKNGTAASFSINEEISHSFISQMCLAYLLRFDSLDPIDNKTIELLPLAEYAADNWVFHARLGGNDSTPLVQKLIMELLKPGSPQLLNWIRLHDPDRYFRVNLQPSLEVTAEPLYYASRLGFPEVLRLLLESGALANSKGRERDGAKELLFSGYENALQAACGEGHQNIVGTLLEKGADFNVQGGWYGNSLQAASYRGHERIVRLLIEEGMDVNVRGGFYGNALQTASYRGHEAIVKLLLEKGAKVNKQGGWYGNALQSASAGGHEAIVRLLVEKGAAVNMQGGWLGNALQAASHGGHETVTRLLMEKGADVNMQGGWLGNALQAASYGGHETVIRLLMEQGADINAQGGKYGNSLQAASYGGREAIVKLLVEKGADVNAQGGKYGNSLQAASYGGHEAIVKLLVEKGADVNAQGGEYGNALEAASYRSHEAIIRLLIEEGADVNVQGGEDGNALEEASYSGHETIVRMLLERGADVNAQGGTWGNALQAASSGGHELIVRLLMENGAEINAQGGWLGNALQAASYGGHGKIVRLLMEKGTDVNMQGGMFGTALQAASYGGHETVIKMLVEKGANVNAQGGTFGTALQAASIIGHKRIVRLFLENHAEVNSQGGLFGNALQAASLRGNISLVVLLLDNGADVHAQGGYYSNALHAASTAGHTETVTLLLQKGADFNRNEAQDTSTLIEAFSDDDRFIVEHLCLEHWVDINPSERPSTNTLVSASHRGHGQVVRLLLEHGVDAQSRDEVLKAETSKGYDSIVRRLLYHDIQ